MQTPYTLHSMQKRILAIVIVLILLAAGVGVRLFYVQVISAKNLQQRATDQWTRDLSLVGERGAIYDTTGDTLAVSYTTYNVYVRAREVTEKERTAQALAKLLDLNYEKLSAKVKNTSVSESLIKMQIDSNMAEKIYDLKLDGVYLSENVGRHYVYGDLLSQVIGFTSIDGKGQSGAEAYFDSYLRGIDGYSYVQSDLQGKEISSNLRYYVSGEAGNSLNLTINSKIQLILENTLKTCYTEQQAKTVTGLVFDVSSGQILAISSKPSFDLNEVPRDDLEALFEYSKLKAATDSYEPGSTFKILTLAIAVEEGLVAPSTTFYCPGYRIVDGQKIKCWKTTGHGSQTLIEAFANSCNCCFMDLALKIGVDRFYKYAQIFGLGQKSGLTVSGESGGILMNKANVKRVDLARMGFGHAIAVTPIQLMSAVSGVVNGGIYHTPTIVKNITSPKNVVVYTPKVVEKRIISAKTSEFINKCLQFASNRTGAYTFIEGYDVGGKTGTAQKYSESGSIAQGKYISSFIGTYPASAPKYAVMILVDEPGTGAYYGSVVASPYGKMFYSNLFDYLDQPKDDDNFKRVEVLMPDVVGMNIVQAMVLFKSLNLYCEVYGEGSVITKQLPPEGTVCYEGETVIVCT